MKIRIIILILTIFCTLQIFSQQANFGKNKVQYKKFEWSYIQTAHFDIYFYQSGKDIALFTTTAAESAYASISKSFKYQINNRIPIMVYNSHNDFQQTNVIGEYLEEGVGGVTELFKNRVVLPFEGDYKQFRHVIHHELVHAVINDMFYGGSIQSIISNNITLQLPLWFNEGIAEYEALKWDTNSDMFMRDATLNTYLPPIERLGGYFAYRGGQSVWYYIANKYGEGKISEILNRVKGSRSLDQGFKAAIGLTVSELSERWQKEQKKIYWPDISKREDPEDFATRITNHTKENNFYNTSPAISPQGDKIAFISDRDDYFDVFIISTIDNKIEKIIDGQQTKNFEELHLLTPGISWSPDGKRIAISVKSGERDAIFLVDVKSGEQEKIDFNLEGIFSVDWSHQGNKLAFVGNTSTQSDIYMYDLETKQLTNLTKDIFSDADPSWSPDGTTVYFVSDRNGNLTTSLPKNFSIATYNYSQKDIYSIDIQSKTITQITNDGKSDETSPIVADSGKKLLYVSDRNGIGNVYERILATNEVRPITNSITGVYQLSLSRDGNKLAFSSLSQAGFDIFLLKTPMERKLTVQELELTEHLKRKNTLTQIFSDTASPKNDTTELYGKNIRIDFNNYTFSEDTTLTPSSNLASLKNTVDEEGNYKVQKYKISFSPDIVYGSAGFSTFYGVQGTTIMAFSDMLGDHQIVFQTNLLLDLKNSDYILSYYYFPGLIDYGIQGYHSARFLQLSNPYGLSIYRFRSWGASVLASYPLDKFRRLESSLNWMNLSRENLDYVPAGFADPNQNRVLIFPTLSYVYDTVLWGMLAPNNGTRYNLSAMVSPSLGKNSVDFQTFTLDYRTYFKFWNEYSFAIRLSGGISLGKNPQNFFIGGTENWINYDYSRGIPIRNVEDYAFLSPVVPLRGYDMNVSSGNKFALMNYELRFPLIRYLVTGGLPLFFQNILGVAFVDVGSAWTDTKAYKGFTVDEQKNVVTQDLLIGTGFGTRIFFFGLPFKIDAAWSFNGAKFSKPKYYISLGGDF